MLLLQRDFPKTILIGDTMWQIKFVRNVPATTTPGRTVDGLCEPETCIIYIRKGLKPLYRLEVVLHEILHAIDFEYGITLDHKLIEKLEKPLQRLLMDNIKPR